MATSSGNPIRPVVIFPRTAARPDSPANSSVESRQRELQMLANWMDSAFEIPGLGIRFGLDSLIGLIPGLGDTLTSLVALYIVGSASRLGVPRVTLVRMTLNVAIDWLLGSIPLLGDVFDVYWKANQMNMALLRKHLAAQPIARPRASTGDWLFVAAVGSVAVLAVVGGVTIAVLAFKAIASFIFAGI